MPVFGTHKQSPGFQKAVIKAMCLDTTEASVDQILEHAVRFTPQGETGKLRAGWKTTRPRGGKARGYRADVKNSVKYVRAIEYGVAPFRITPDTRDALKFLSKEGEVIFRNSANHPGWEGKFMASKAARFFESIDARRIAEFKAWTYLS